jgi:hypothetical protein
MVDFGADATVFKSLVEGVGVGTGAGGLTEASSDDSYSMYSNASFSAKAANDDTPIRGGDCLRRRRL